MKSRSAWLSYSASSSASSARPYHCWRQYTRSIFVTPIGGRPTRPLLAYSGSITAISRGHGTMRSMSARNFSRLVCVFFIAYSALAKLRWLMPPWRPRFQGSTIAVCPDKSAFP